MTRVAEKDDLVVGHLGARLETGPGRRRVGRSTVHLLQLDCDGPGLHLVAALIAEADRTGVPDIAAALDDDGAVAALHELGFRPARQPPQWLVSPA